MEGVTITCPVVDGRLNPTDHMKAYIAKYLATREGKTVVVKFNRPTNTRSQRQNRYYWGVVLTLVAEMSGMTTEDAHTWFVDEFLPRRFVTLGSKEKEIRKTTTELTTGEFEVYLERIRVWAGEPLGIVIPLPNE